jgi:hypothetical protein
MGQELLNVDVSWTRKPRTYYLATTSSGKKFVRGSATDCYTHAVVCDKSPHFRPNQIETYGTCHGREDLAKRTFNRWKKETSLDWEWQLVELVKITAKEVREIKKQTKKEYNEWREENKNDNSN